MLYLSPAITIYCSLVALLLGACMGSFLNCMAWRIVHGESILRGRSHCDACGHVLTARDLFPVFSYLFAREKCRYCGAKLSVRHVIAEGATALVYLAILLRYDISLQTLEMLAFATVLLGCAFADLEGYIVPDRLIVAGIVSRAVFLLIDPTRLVDALLGGFAVVGGLLLLVLAYEKLRKVDAMGGGDIKLLFVTGLYLGWMQNLLCLLLACVLGIVFGIVAQKKDENAAIPWAPAIATAAILTALTGDAIITAYLGLF